MPLKSIVADALARADQSDDPDYSPRLTPLGF